MGKIRDVRVVLSYLLNLSLQNYTLKLERKTKIPIVMLAARKNDYMPAIIKRERK